VRLGVSALPGRAVQDSLPAPFQLVWGARQRNKQFVRLAAPPAPPESADLGKVLLRLRKRVRTGEQNEANPD
jgi:hypothetical protein